jgi:hypothetical protein
MSGLNFEIVQAAEDITTGAASVQSTAAPVGTTHVRLACTVACRFLIGTNPTAVATSSLLNAVNNAELFAMAPGYKVAAIQEAAGGKLSVTFIRATRR